MKTEIYYFSGTGNSLAVAKKIAKEIKQADIFSISELLSQNRIIKVSADVIGFIFPVYLHALPKQVKKFIEMISIKNKPYIFAIATNNGEPGSAGDIINNILKKKNLELCYYNQILMPGNSIAYDGYTNSKEEQIFRLKKSEESAIKISSEILKQKKYKSENSDSVAMKMKYSTQYWLLNNIIKLEKRYYVRENCTQCGICSRVCPSKNIKLSNSKISWGKNCEYCFACFHWCPVKASQINPGCENRIRYTHPEISVKEISYR